MDPVGPWSAYAASYNRLANASSFQNAPSSEYHPSMGGGMQPAPSSSQLLSAHASSVLSSSTASPYTSTGFLSPPPVGYDSVFPPLFHQKAHYGIQHRQIKQTEADPYNQMTPNAYYDQNNVPSMPWSQNNQSQLPSPFGILPHESVVPNSPVNNSKTYENLNSHFGQSLNPISDYKNSSFVDPKKRPISPTKAYSGSAPYYQQLPPSADHSALYKQNDYSIKSAQNGQLPQTYDGSYHTDGKEYRMPQAPQQRNDKPRSFPPSQLNAQKQPLKPYDTDKHTEFESQSSPISFAMMDSQRGFQSTKIRSQQLQQISNQQPYRFPMTPESDYQRSKSTESFGSTSSNPDYSIGLPKRPSPLDTQASPTAQAHSPVYPMYNSPLTTISSPSPVPHDPCFNKQQPDIPPPLDVSVSRNIPSSSVITRIDSRYDKQDYNRLQWDDRQRKYAGYDSQLNQSRQQYYDPGHQVTLQDLSSCRGDPMSLVKTLQQQQPEKDVEEKQKRHRSSKEKSPDPEYASRVPPPAHGNQNSSFDFDRWGLAPPQSKAYSTSPVPFNSQNNPDGNESNNRPQSLMVSHAGAAPPYPTPFHLPASNPPSAPPSSEEGPEPQPQPAEPPPEIIVPKIEDELDFLLSNDLNQETIPRRKVLCPNPNSGFMSSFAKFIQGEKESSPPPAAKRVKRVLSSNVYSTPERKNSLSSDVPSLPEFPSDPQDDPRYFPLPKPSDKRTFNSSDSESSNPDIPDNPEVDISQAVPVINENPPSIDINLPSTSSKKEKKRHKSSHKKKKKKKKKKKSSSREPTEVATPKRELGKRKAKERLSSSFEDDTGRTTNDSDSDPAWSPSSDEDDDSSPKRSKKSYKKGARDLSSDSSEEEYVSKKVSRRSKKGNKKTSVKEKTIPVPTIIYPSKPSSKASKITSKVGEFVIVKADAHLRHPPIWRLKEPTILQKYLHYFKDGNSFYKNLMFHTGLSSDFKNKYQGVAVKVISVAKNDMVVQLLSNDIMAIENKELIDEYVNKMSVYQEKFDVYVQTLFSVALDSNFLIEIYRDQDEYFLSNTVEVNCIVTDLENRMVDCLSWPEEMLDAIQSHPSYTSTQRGGLTCVCGTAAVQLLTLYGGPYNKDTLLFQQDDSTASQWEGAVCRECLSLVEIVYKLSHFKIYLHSICEDRVNEMKKSDPNKDAALILNDLLCDDTWISQLYKDVCKDWGFAEAAIKQLGGEPTTLPI